MATPCCLLCRFTLFTTHLLVDEVRPDVKWHAVKKGVSTCAGVYTWLLHRYRSGIGGTVVLVGG